MRNLDLGRVPVKCGMRKVKCGLVDHAEIFCGMLCKMLNADKSDFLVLLHRDYPLLDQMFHGASVRSILGVLRHKIIRPSRFYCNQELDRLFKNCFICYVIESNRKITLKALL